MLNLARVVLQVIIEIAAADGIGRLWIVRDGLMSKPPVSAVIRYYLPPHPSASFICSNETPSDVILCSPWSCRTSLRLARGPEQTS